MRSPRELTRADILATANRFRWLRKMPKWTVIIDNRELPARPLVLEAAGVPPNDPTNSHQANAKLENHGFETRYAADSSKSNEPLRAVAPAEGLRNNRSILEIVAEATKDIPEEDWERFPADFSKNIDHYLYGTKRDKE
jgi:hypothetical protein